MASTTEFLVSKSGQMSVPAGVRRRWGLTDGGRVTVIDLGDAVVLLPSGARGKLLDDALSAEDHLAFDRRLRGAADERQQLGLDVGVVGDVDARPVLAALAQHLAHR